MMNGDELLTADEILAMDDIPVEEVTVPEWGHRKVLVCGLTAAAKNAYEASLVELKGSSRKVKLDNATAKLLVRCLVNRARQPLFTETQIERLGTKSAAALDRLATVAQRLSAMRQEDVEELIKNSDATQGDVSASVSL